MVAAYLLLASAGLGFNAGLGVGLNLDRELIPDLGIYVRAEYVDQDKATSPGDRYGGMVLLRYRWLEFGGGYAKTRTERWNKEGTRLIAGIRKDNLSVQYGLRYLGKDSTVNEAEGFELWARRSRRLFLEGRIVGLRFDGDRTDTVGTLAIGYSFP